MFPTRNILRLTSIVAAVSLAFIATIVWGAPLVFALGPASGTAVSDAVQGAGSYPAGAPFFNGQTVEIKIPANSIFKQGLRVNVLECSDPGGSAANLPISIDNCDGNTIQGPTVLIQSRGTIEFADYTIYQLPNFPQLGESKTWQPVCNMTHECVLYIGENQEDFRAPHYFSQPFLVNWTKSGALASPRTPVDGSGGPNATFLAILMVAVVLVAGTAFLVVRRRSIASNKT